MLMETIKKKTPFCLLILLLDTVHPVTVWSSDEDLLQMKDGDNNGQSEDFDELESQEEVTDREIEKNQTFGVSDAAMGGFLS